MFGIQGTTNQCYGLQDALDLVINYFVPRLKVSSIIEVTLCHLQLVYNLLGEEANYI